MKIDTTAPQTTTSGSFSLLETDTYLMEITSAKLEANTFADPNKDGTQPEQLVLVWELAENEARIEELELQGDEKVWQRMNPFYGNVKAGGPSKFKAFVDSLISQGLIEPEFDTDDLVGITQKVSVEKYLKTMGANVGQPGNRVTAVGPIKRGKRIVVPEATPTKTEKSVPINEQSLPF